MPVSTKNTENIFVSNHPLIDIFDQHASPSGFSTCVRLLLRILHASGDVRELNAAHHTWTDVA